VSAFPFVCHTNPTRGGDGSTLVVSSDKSTFSKVLLNSTYFCSVSTGIPKFKGESRSGSIKSVSAARMPQASQCTRIPESINST
jgi:hypothetical protein